MSDFHEFTAHDARLIILRALHSETSQTLNELLLLRALETYGHNHSRDYVRTQLRALKDLGAVTLREPAPTVMIATITRLGIDHVERRAVIEGVLRPSPGS